MVIYAGSYHLSNIMDGENRIILNVGGVRYVQMLFLYCMLLSVIIRNNMEYWMTTKLYVCSFPFVSYEENWYPCINCANQSQGFLPLFVFNFDSCIFYGILIRSFFMIFNFQRIIRNVSAKLATTQKLEQTEFQW